MDPFVFGSPHPSIRVERDGPVATVTIDRPKSKNACTGGMWVALGSIFAGLGTVGLRAIVLTGAGGDFCAGAELGGTSEARGADGRARTGSMLDGMRVLGDAVMAIHNCPVPVIAKVDGICVGAGLGLALAADMTWCSDRARLCAIFAKRGLSLDFGTSWLLCQRVGVHRAKELTLTARMISGTEALELGLVNAAVPADALDGAVQAVVDAVAAGPPVALSMSKRELNHASMSSLAQMLEHEALAQAVNVHTEDTREALTAFAERRAPVFKGR